MLIRTFTVKVVEQPTEGQLFKYVMKVFRASGEKSHDDQSTRIYYVTEPMTTKFVGCKCKVLKIVAFITVAKQATPVSLIISDVFVTPDSHYNS